MPPILNFCFVQVLHNDDFLALLDISKTTLNDIRNQNTRTNVAKNLEFAEVALKYKIYFKPTGKIIVICYLIVI